MTDPMNRRKFAAVAAGLIGASGVAYAKAQTVVPTVTPVPTLPPVTETPVPPTQTPVPPTVTPTPDPVTPTPEPEPVIDPRIRIRQNPVQYGAVMHVKGRGFVPGEKVTITRRGTANGAQVVIADEDGRFLSLFRAPKSGRRVQVTAVGHVSADPARASRPLVK